MGAQSKWSFVFMLLWWQFVSSIVGIKGVSGDSILLIKLLVRSSRPLGFQSYFIPVSRNGLLLQLHSKPRCEGALPERSAALDMLPSSSSGFQRCTALMASKEAIKDMVFLFSVWASVSAWVWLSLNSCVLHILCICTPRFSLLQYNVGRVLYWKKTRRRWTGTCTCSWADLIVGGT